LSQSFGRVARNTVEGEADTHGGEGNSCGQDLSKRKKGVSQKRQKKKIIFKIRTQRGARTVLRETRTGYSGGVQVGGQKFREGRKG